MGVCTGQKTAGGNARDRLELAKAVLIEAQAPFLTQSAQIERRLADTERVHAKRFACSENYMAAISGIPAEHSQILSAFSRSMKRLSEAVRDKIEFKAQHSLLRSARPGWSNAESA
jgi:hypothetical protein